MIPRRQGRAGVLVRWLNDGLHRGRSAAVRLVLPPRCVQCDRDLHEQTVAPLLCSGCRTLFTEQDALRCRRCGATVPETGTVIESCAWCKATQPQFDSVLPLATYKGGLREAVLRMKHPAGEPLTLALGRLLGQQHRSNLAAMDLQIVAPIPMYWLRRLARGTNSSEVLADCLARELGVPLARRLLFRNRNTRPQKDLTPLQRFENVKDAFGLRAGYDLQGARVLLVDDILTTGATCSAAAAALKKAGATTVAIAVLARAQGSQSR